MKRTLLLLFAMCAVAGGHLSAQTAMLSTNPVAERIMLGAYDPAAYAAATVIDHPDSISRGIAAGVSTDSLLSYLLALRSFRNRNTGSDTVSSSTGIGAARRWVHSRFAEFGAQSGARLVPSYLQFNQSVCNQPQHRNIFAVLPGRDTSDKSVVIIEGHMDSRCAGLCDTACLAEGMEDNVSGAFTYTLVIDGQRVQSRKMVFAN